MGSLIGPIIGIGLSLLSGSKTSKGFSEAGEAASAKLDPFVNPGVRANRNILNALGFGRSENVDAAFQNFLNSSGFQAQIAGGERAVTSSQSARGLLNSGDTLKRLTTFGQDLAKQGFSNFIGQLGDVADRGVTAAGGQADVLSRSGAAAAEAKGTGFTNAIRGIGEVIASPIVSKIFG